MNKLALAAVAGIATLAAPASAATYLFTVSGSATGSGAIEATPFSATAATITGITGVINGNAITALRPVNDYVNDNVLLFGNEAKFSSAGVGFIAGGIRTDLFYNYGVGSYRIFTPTAGPSSISFDLVSAAVPEPATWAMMIAGFAMVGGAIRRRHAPVRLAA